MHIPKHHEETEMSVLHALIKAHPLGTWVTHGNDELIANHVPFVLDTTRGTYGTLIAHVARANPVWQTFSSTIGSVVIFHGTQTYITPSWYPSKHVDGKAVRLGTTLSYMHTDCRARSRTKSGCSRI